MKAAFVPPSAARTMFRGLALRRLLLREEARLASSGSSRSAIGAATAASGRRVGTGDAVVLRSSSALHRRRVVGGRRASSFYYVEASPSSLSSRDCWTNGAPSVPRPPSRRTAPGQSLRWKSSAAVASDPPASSEFDVVPPTGTVPLPYLLADIGEGIAEVELLSWHVRPGDYVKEHDVVADVQSDKATVPLTSRYEGTVLDLCGMEGDVVSTGSPLMHIAVEGGRYGTAASSSDETAAAPSSPSTEDGAMASTATASATTSTTATVTTPSSSSAETTKKKVVKPFLMADIGEGIVEVELLQWFVRPGDYVRVFEEVAEVQSDKATVPITSKYEGRVVDLGGEKGDIIKVGSPLMHIEVEAEDEDGGDGGEATQQLHNVDDVADRLHIPSVQPSHYPTESEGASSDGRSQVKVLTSPAVRKMAKDHGVNLSAISGSGPRGRILKADLLKLIETTAPAASPPPSGQSTQEVPVTPGTATAAEGTPKYVPGQDVVVPLRGYSRLMVKTMTESLKVPHMVYSDEVDVGKLLQVRRELRPLAEDEGNSAEGAVSKLTLLPFLIKAASLSMAEYPVINSTLDDVKMEVTYRGDHDIGVAVDTPRGLAVPVIRKCQELSVLGIARELERLQKLAADGNLSESDVSRPTFTVSNIGALGGTYMHPVVSPPQVAICAVGRIQRLPRFVSPDSTEVVENHVMNVSWGGDHRAIDGATMARFGNRWRGYVENPASMILDTK